MIGISKLYCGTVEPSDALRYGRLSSSLPSHLLQFSADKRPVVVWNVTRRCNLKCVHCYAQATKEAESNELTTQEGKRLIDDLVAFGVPVLLFSGGEPLVRKDLPDLAEYAVQNGMRAVISTNGTLITPQMARKLKDIGLSYVGISLDGVIALLDARMRDIRGTADQNRLLITAPVPILPSQWRCWLRAVHRPGLSHRSSHRVRRWRKPLLFHPLFDCLLARFR